MKLSELLSQDVGDGCKLILFYLNRSGTATVDQIASKFDWTKGKTLNLVSSLEDKNLIAKLEHSRDMRYTLKQVSR